MTQPTQSGHAVNGVDVDQLFGTIEAIKNRPDLANCQFRATNQWDDGGHCVTEAQGFFAAGSEDSSRPRPFVMDADEPPVLLGHNLGPNPVEYVLTALTSCLTTSLVYHAAARGIRLTEVNSRIEGDLDLHGFLGLDDSVRNGYRDLKVVFDVKGDATPEQIDELIELAQRRSPVFDVVSHGVPVEVRSSGHAGGTA